MRIPILVIVIAIIFAYSIYRLAASQMQVIARQDGTFRNITIPPQTLDTFFHKTGLKPIRLSTILESPFVLHVLNKRTQTLHTITIPTNYVSDGASKPSKYMPFPNDHEGHYWVYHDWMYQKQCTDDGTPISKEDADDIMNQLIFQELSTLIFPYKLLYRLVVRFYKHNDAEYRNALKVRGPAFYDPSKSSISFPYSHSSQHNITFS